MPGRGCAKPPRFSASSASMLPARRSCSHARPATSSCARKLTTWRFAFFSAAGSRPCRCAASAKRRRPSSRISCGSRTGMRSNRRSQTGCGKPTKCRMCCRRGHHGETRRPGRARAAGSARAIDVRRGNQLNCSIALRKDCRSLSISAQRSPTSAILC